MKKIVKRNLVLSLLPLICGIAVTAQAISFSTYAYDYDGDLFGSARIKCNKVRETDTGNVMEINAGGAGNADYSGTGVYLRIKNYTSIDTPLTFKLNSTNGTIIAPTTGVKQSYYDVNGNAVDGVDARGWGNYMMLPASFDGYIYMDYQTQMSKIIGDADFDASHIWRIYIEYSGYYDAYADFAIGDIDTNTHKVLDTSELDEAAFTTTFVNASSEYQSITQNARAPQESFVPSGDLLGGYTCVQSGYGGFMVKFDQLKDLSDGGVAFRIKNNLGVTSWPMVHVASDWFAGRSINKANAPIFRYNANGTGEVETTINEWGYFELPASFDGFIYIPNSSLVDDAGWGAYNPLTANALYIEGSDINLSIGDIFSKSVVAFDGSEHYANEMSNFTETWSGATISILPGYKEVEVTLYDYSLVNYVGEIDGGLEITASKCNDSSLFSSTVINFESGLDLSAGEAVAINSRGEGSYAYQLEFVDDLNNVLQMPDAGNAAKNPIHFVSEGVASSVNHLNGDPNTIHLTNSEGVLVAEKAFLKQKSGEGFNWSSVKKIVVTVHTFYDSGFRAVFGDIGVVSQENANHTVVASLNDYDDFDSIVTTDEYLAVSKYHAPRASSWIGDVKIIDSLNYKNDVELKKNITYDIGDNACSYQKEDDGVFVHIGPYETGHAYGSYMCLGIFDKGLTTDRTQAWRMNGDVKEYAKGVTFYAENRSNKEIGLTLQFDENIPGQETTERWCVVGYPAMYYAYDVVTGADYLMYSKSDQIQLPVGFKGYVRVPFTSYSVPNWNAGQNGVDEVLDLDNFSGNFFLTSDNTRFEDLEFFIKNVGLYFNTTRKGNAFSSENTIKSNMGLE